MPSEYPNGLVVVDHWDRQLDVVRFAGGCARWDPDQGNPFSRPVGVWLSWHSDQRSGVAVIGRAIETHQVYRDLDPSDSHLSSRQEQTRDLKALEKFPDDEVIASDGTRLLPAGALVRLADVALTEPTAVEVADDRAARERGRRTVNITGPAQCFGEHVPGCGEHVQIDLDDVRLNVSGAPDGLHGIVLGMIAQVDVMRPYGLPVEGASLMMMVDVDAGQATSEISDDLFVVLVIDERCLG